LAKHISNLEESPILGSDILDALIGAYTVYLHAIGESEVVTGDGEIVIPRISRYDAPQRELLE